MRLRHRLGYAAAGLLALLILLAPPAYRTLFPPTRVYASDREHFLYGSVGVEPVQGLPLRIWETMPGICMPTDQQAAGYRRFGFLWEPGHATPVGMPVERVGVDRIGINCALCHAGEVRGPDGQARLIAGAPNTRLNLQAYLRFLQRCAASPAFTPEAVFTEAERLGHPLSAMERLFYRRIVLPQVKQQLAKQAWQLQFMDDQTDWGPGRSPGFQPAKIQILGLPFDGTLDITDFPALWNMRGRRNGLLHWDGVNSDLHEVVLNSGIGNGASARSIDRASLDRIERWLIDLRSPRFPWPVNAALAAQGKSLFAQECADCHAPGGAKTGQAIPIAWTGTDRNRLDAMTQETVDGFSRLDIYPWRYRHFAKTDGYVAAPLDGIWARAPYLHNGSVPTLDALLLPPNRRPVRFGRGSTSYDPVAGGFRSDRGTLFDTQLPGNGNGGHLWGTERSDAERHALVEYLKTL
ncbi:c-type cytochrome [Sphingomonas azotifigens]|uniref:c-type cytochrome n=1 Tax=Sphingomonas azotifigens TaxID=330920 RepID=UPI000A04601F|nr:c-type cytochrome [Sphingomonas azotifigens]